MEQLPLKDLRERCEQAGLSKKGSRKVLPALPRTVAQPSTPSPRHFAAPAPSFPP